MTASPMTLLEGSLAFDRAGKTLIAAERDAISIIELGGDGQTTRLPIHDARAIAAFVDQLWIVTHDDRLVRVDRAGRALGPPCALPFATRAVLDPAPCGPAAAIWPSSPAVALIEHFGQLASTELVGGELTLPLTGRRFVTAHGARLTLPSGRVTMLAPGTTVLGGAVMSDGQSVTLLVARDGGRQLIVVSLGTGQVTRRCATPSSTVRLAARRSIAIALVEPRMIWGVDLHTGRELGTVGFEHDVDDFAIDPDGQTLAVRFDSGAIELHQLGDLLRRPPATVRAVLELGAVNRSSDARTTCPPAHRFDVSDVDDVPTLNIRRPRPRIRSGSIGS